MEKRRQVAHDHKELMAKIKAAEFEKQILSELKQERKAEYAKNVAGIPRSYKSNEVGQGVKDWKKQAAPKQTAETVGENQVACSSSPSTSGAPVGPHSEQLLSVDGHILQGLRWWHVR